MFPVKCKELLPLDHVMIHSVAVRGRLGPLTVWVSKEEQSTQPRGFRMNPRFWEKIYERTHGPSFREYVRLDLRANPIKLMPGQTRAIYIHSTLPGDEAIVYDNRKDRRTYDDALVSILTGRAHVSTTPFGSNPIWGWGNPWRDQREFVGRLEYGAVYRLWNPQEFLNFGEKFQQVARTLFLCQRRWESPLSRLPDECIFYILNMCRWDWANDSPADMKIMRKKQKARAAAGWQMQIEQEQNRSEEMAPVAAAAAAAQLPVLAPEEEESPTRSCCNRRSHEGSDDDEEAEEEEYHAAREDETSDDEDAYVDEIYEDFEDEFEGDDVEEEAEEEEDSDEDWQSDDGYGADGQLFEYEDDASDEEDNAAGSNLYRGRVAWIQRFRGIHVLHALAALDDNGVEEMNH